jgi:CheY-like chemotaxis protein
MEQKAKILIIEDDQDVSEAMRVALEARQYQVDSATDPQLGLGKVRQWRPNLVILDVMFGRRQQAKGFEAAIQIRRDPEIAAIPILMVTAVNLKYPGFNFSPETDGEYLPVDGFIEKPVQPQDLVRQVEELLAGKTSRWKQWPKSDA